MITQVYLTGDCHGDFTRFYKLNQAVPEGEMWSVIILGDAGFNFWLSKSEHKMKKRIGHAYPNLVFYCVRGNHEERPENLPNIKEYFDPCVNGLVWVEPEFPYIVYLKDGATYYINSHKILVVGGAYSVDKYYRLERAAAGGYAGWFDGEQLTEAEREAIMGKVKGQHFDLVLAHTCPWEWEPRDLFLSCVDQTSVDDSMERWLTELMRAIDWNKFCCGHFHDDRIIAPNARMLMFDIVDLENIMGS